ncbi:hypothetical protein [uncultured Vagococcus sp.]|nr:hypothetical protein [uncultured Vagococcus sp.]
MGKAIIINGSSEGEVLEVVKDLSIIRHGKVYEDVNHTQIVVDGL